MQTEDFISTTNVNPIEIWPNIKEEIAKNISIWSYDVWIETLEIVDIKEKEWYNTQVECAKKYNHTQFDIKHTVGNTFVCIIFQVVS